MLLHVKELKQRGLDLYLRWKQFVCEGKMLNRKKLFPLIDDLHDYKVEIIRRLNDGEWLGAAYVSFVDHILRELLYFEDKLRGIPLSAAEEVEFWNRINSEHAGFASHLLDPEHEFLTDTADKISKKIKGLPVGDDLSSIVMAIEGGVEINLFNKAALLGTLTKTIKSVLPEDLIHHVIREGQYGNKILSDIIGVPVRHVNNPRICDKEDDL